VLQIQHDGQITSDCVKSPCQKYFALCRRPGSTEGRFAIVTIRWAQDAMDAVISGVTARFPKGVEVCRRTKERRVRRSRVVLAPRPWRYVGGKYPADNGGKKGRFPGRARISRKAIARGKPGCPGCTCQTRVRCFAVFAHGAAGAVSARLSLRPLRFRGPTRLHNSGENLPRECFRLFEN
jgi:hypothetical protein